MEDLNYIKNFSKISISKICEEKNINRQNLLNNNSSKKNAKIVRNEIENKIFSLYVNNDLKNEIIRQKNELENKLLNITDDKEIDNINYCLDIIEVILKNCED